MTTFSIDPFTDIFIYLYAYSLKLFFIWVLKSYLFIYLCIYLFIHFNAVCYHHLPTTLPLHLKWCPPRPRLPGSLRFQLPWGGMGEWAREMMHER